MPACLSSPLDCGNRIPKKIPINLPAPSTPEYQSLEAFPSSHVHFMGFLGEILSGGSKKLRSNFVYEILRGKWLAWLFFKKVNKIK
jgi:hypothetical protein